jgi:hypothetical protein
LRLETAHFALYWKDGTTITEADAKTIWSKYFSAPINFPEPYCDNTKKWKAAVHFDNSFPLLGGGWSRNGINYAGMWVGPSAAKDPWGLAHEFMHGVQSLTPGFAECGGQGCWIYESHANWMPHQIYRDNVHCSEMLVNSPHLHYGNTRDRYCNWQFFEYIKDRFCPDAINDMWTSQAPQGQRDPFQKLMYANHWSIEDLNNLFGEWAMHNVSWDYKDPDGSDQGAVYRKNYGAITQTNYAQRRLRLTQLESLDSSWAQSRRFNSPYYWAPQRWGYNLVRLYPDTGAKNIKVKFRGVPQPEANAGWRWGLVATDSNIQNPRYSSLQSGTDGELNFCLNANEHVFLMVLAAPTAYEKITWQQPSDGTPYANIYRYPYMLEFTNAWPEGFRNGVRDPCPNNLVRHTNGGGCAPANTASTVYVGPYATIISGTVTDNARIENQAMIVNGTVSSNARVGALTTLGVAASPQHAQASFNVADNATVLATFYPMGWFANNSTAKGSVQLLGDLEYYASAKTSGVFYGLVDDAASGVSSVKEVTLPPPYSWRN